MFAYNRVFLCVKIYDKLEKHFMYIKRVNIQIFIKKIFCKTKRNGIDNRNFELNFRTSLKFHKTNNLNYLFERIIRITFYYSVREKNVSFNVLKQLLR